jgi:hypothetical protein
MKRISDYFAQVFPHINFQGLDESVVRDFMARPYLDGLGFTMTMNCLADYIVANDLTEVSL